MKKTGLTVPMVMLAVVLSACSTTGSNGGSTAATTGQAGGSTPSPAKPSSSTAAAPSTTLSSTALPAHKDANNVLTRERNVYFDYDDFSIASTYQGVITNHGQYLQRNPKLAIRIEGHADERGSAEYNLALGQKRAESVMRALKLYGVKDGQMEAVSYGEERPSAAGHDEAAWSKNRRAEIAYRD